MFDNFDPFKILEKENFTFQPSRYEMWIGGEMVRSGKSDRLITAEVVEVAGIQKVEVTFDDTSLHAELSPSNIFDVFVTAKDRLLLIVLTEQTSENRGIKGFEKAFGSAMKLTNLTGNQPYCCSLFLQQGNIAKVTFSYSNPKRLLEFYP
ncbi:MAG: hypothetical protein WKF70_07500 [Chitinophagaceae bacterium]